MVDIMILAVRYLCGLQRTLGRSQNPIATSTEQLDSIQVPKSAAQPWLRDLPPSRLLPSPRLGRSPRLRLAMLPVGFSLKAIFALALQHAGEGTCDRQEPSQVKEDEPLIA